MRKSELIEILKEHEVDENYNTSDIFELLSCLPVVQETLYDSSRWWDVYGIVVKTKSNRFLKYYKARSTGDSTPLELGYEGNDLNDITEVYPKEVITIIYE